MKALKAALLGRSLTHSISPAVHEALFPLLCQKLNCRFERIAYTNIECENEDVFLGYLNKDDRVGFSVTFPYKYLASQLSEDANSLVHRIKSANTILTGKPPSVYSTDGAGFVYALEKACPPLVTKDYQLVVIGAGGAARAVMEAVYARGWRGITVRARALSEARRSFERYTHVTVLPLESFDRMPGNYLIIHATPVGQRGSDSLLQHFDWQTGDIAIDLVYNPLRTKFLDSAEVKGATAVDGLGMLIEQAALSQHIWMSGEEADESLLTLGEFQELHRTLSTHLAPRWDAFAS